MNCHLVFKTGWMPICYVKLALGIPRSLPAELVQRLGEAVGIASLSLAFGLSLTVTRAILRRPTAGTNGLSFRESGGRKIP